MYVQAVAKNRRNRRIITVLLFGNIDSIVAVWVHNLRSLGELSTKPSALLTGLGHLTGLLAAFLILCQLLMLSRIWLLERAYGMERLTQLHRKNGYLIFYLLLAHIVFLTIGYQLTRGATFLNQLGDFLTNFPDVLKATLGFAGLVVVTVSSIRIARRKLPYEWWYYVHVTAYFAVALAFGHQLSVGLDFLGHPLFVAYWYGLYIVTFVAIVLFRFLWPLLLFAKYRFKIAEVVSENHNTHSVIITGKQLQRFSYQPGQFAIWHILERGRWWQAHPFSFTSQPGSDSLRFTAKESGDFTRTLSTVRPGTLVIVDGPHGQLTLAAASKNMFLLIAAGAGITPIFSLAEELIAKKLNVVLLYGCQSPQDVVFSKEIKNLEVLGKMQVHYFFSRADSNEAGNRIDKAALKRLVPDIAKREIYLCGPESIMKSLIPACGELGVPKAQIHSERFSF